MDRDKYIKSLESIIKYQEAYDVLMEYWDYIPDEEKPSIHRKLKKLGL